MKKKKKGLNLKLSGKKKKKGRTQKHTRKKRGRRGEKFLISTPREKEEGGGDSYHLFFARKERRGFSSWGKGGKIGGRGEERRSITFPNSSEKEKENPKNKSAGGGNSIRSSVFGGKEKKKGEGAVAFHSFESAERERKKGTNPSLLVKKAVRGPFKNGGKREEKMEGHSCARGGRDFFRRKSGLLIGEKGKGLPTGRGERGRERHLELFSGERRGLKNYLHRREKGRSLFQRLFSQKRKGGGGEKKEGHHQYEGGKKKFVASEGRKERKLRLLREKGGRGKG